MSVHRSKLPVHRQVGAILALVQGLVWAGFVAFYALAHDTPPSDESDLDLSPLGLALVVSPFVIPWLVGGWLTWRGHRGWRWAPILASAAVMFFIARSAANTPFLIIELLGNAAVVLLLLLPSRRRVA